MYRFFLAKIKYLSIPIATIAFFVCGAFAQADTQGQQQSFFVNKTFDGTSRTSLPATLRAIGEHAYWYVDDAYWSELATSQQVAYLADLQKLAKEFDDRIYPTETSVWGFEDKPGIDGDSRITILLEKLTSGYGGYFESVHNILRKDAPFSNQREMVVLSAHSPSTDYGKAFLAHEFQHLISYNQKEILRNVSEEVWLNELRSEYAPELVGYNTPYETSNLARRVQAFLRESEDSLAEWNNLSADYAAVSMFGYYIAGRYGTAVLADTLHDSGSGVGSIEQYLRKQSPQKTFGAVFLDWMVASYINDSTSPMYGYANDKLRSLKVEPTSRSVLREGVHNLISNSLKVWEPAWHEFTPATALDASHAIALDFEGMINGVAAYVLFYNDGSYEVFQQPLPTTSTTIYVVNPDSKTSPKQITKVLLAATHSETNPDRYGQASILDVTASLVPVTEASPLHIIGQDEVKNGVLIKRSNSELEMYVIEGKYKRYLRPEIIKLYGQLDPAKVIPLDNEMFNSYTTANYVRSINDQKVYAVWPDGTKHWLRITPQQWDASGRDWNAIFIINDAELNSYRTGADITR